MDVREDSERFESFPATTLRNLSSSSSVFFSANQSPFFSPRQPTASDAQFDTKLVSTDHLVSPTTVFSNSTLSSYSGLIEMHRKQLISHDTSFSPVPVSLSRVRSYDIFIGLHGCKPALLRFANWLKAELEIQGMSCFVADRARCRSSRKHGMIERAMNGSSFGIVILTRKCFRNPYSIEEIRYFSGKKNLVPVFFDLSPDDCLVRDIVEKRGDLWEKHGGELWLFYGGLEKEWKEALHGLSRVDDEWKMEAQDGEWRDCVLKTVGLLASRLGRRSVMDRLTKWREKAEREEFPFPRNEFFVGRKEELSELEFILFGDISGETEKDYFELKTKPRKKKNIKVSSSSSRKGKEPVVWKESENEIEMNGAEFSQIQRHQRRRNGRRKRSTKTSYGKGIACVTGESGIGKTELLLEFAYRYHQRYKMVLWIGGESRYIRQNYLNLWSFLDIDIGVENCSDKTRIRSFEEQEEAAISRVRKELMRNIPYLVIIDNLETEKDWWDCRLVMDLLPRFGSETQILISTRLPRVMNLEPVKLSYLSGLEAMCLMQGGEKEKENDYTVEDIDALRAIEEKLGRLTLGLSIVGAILSELPINPSRLLETINRMPLTRESHSLRKNTFFLQLLEVCFSIFDHAEGSRSLATRMVQVSGWFAPGAVPVSLLALAANKIPKEHKRSKLWRKMLTCGLTSSNPDKSGEASSSILLRFNIARTSTKNGHINFNDLIKLYSCKRTVTGTPHATVQAVLTRGSIFHHPDHVWATCFLLLGFGKNPKAVELSVTELLYFIKELALPLAIRTFITFSRCTAAVELLRLCTEALEAADQAFVTPVEKSGCFRAMKTKLR